LSRQKAPGRGPGKIADLNIYFRASGTEPLIRCYIKAKTKANLKKFDAAWWHLLTD
jgi:phosphomannomutase